jgi:hypothetical protein
MIMVAMLDFDVGMQTATMTTIQAMILGAFLGWMPGVLLFGLLFWRSRRGLNGRNDEVESNRPEAIRRLVELGLKSPRAQK